MTDACLSFAPRLHRGHRRQIRWKLVCFEVFNLQLDQTDERTTEIRFVCAAAIDDHADAGNDAAVLMHDVDRLLDASAARDDVFGDDEFFVSRS